jgi:hypothetical protein
MLYLLLYCAKRGSFGPNRYARKQIGIVKASETELNLAESYCYSPSHDIPRVASLS